MIIELVYRDFKFISLLLLKFSLLYSNDPIESLSLIFYIDDFFDNFRDFEY